VDLPGFGYAKTGKRAIRQWGKLTEHYFNSRRSIVLTVQILDSRMPPTPLDIQMSEWLERLKIPRMLVAMKSDKLSANQKAAQSRIMSDYFPGQAVLMCSARTGAGCKEIWKRVLQAAAFVEIPND